MTYSGRVPNFFVPGVQKAGTTYLCRQIARHPDIFFSKMKEPHFFHQKHFTEEAIEDYLTTHFTDAGEERWVGEGSTRYFQSDEAAARIADRFGTDLRFIVAFRQPTEKAVSLYLHNFKRGRLTGRESILQMKAGGVAVVPFSLFAHGCRTYIDTFGRERIHFMRYDDLVADPLGFVNSASASSISRRSSGPARSLRTPATTSPGRGTSSSPRSRPRASPPARCARASRVPSSRNCTACS